MMPPLLYDVFCGAGGATKGFQMAGFRVIGVDSAPQPHYCGDGFIQMDAFTFFDAYQRGEFETASAFHCSPPCQGYSKLRHLPWLRDKVYPLLLEPTLTRLRQIRRPWICENVASAPLNGLVLCGQMFGLKVFRHRRFASSHLLWAPDHKRHNAVIGHGNKLHRASSPHSLGYLTLAGDGSWHIADARRAMDINWMTRGELSQSIPPAYTNFLGCQLRTILHNTAQEPQQGTNGGPRE